ncbi:helix-turn-helix domain-containing protein [Escherichia coli]|uniref:helix-turn-helix domain-containing protein n=1 Tax=Escherichia coli TaxID=562 RepID=UPI001E19730A|nr:helix-turn-helix domain-containing protein [Escherichia coli]MBB6805004.1 helix-turn-helix domain-containing protein [Escherichia coli]MCW9859611.1 helix-turn-helix domain-containing protein [Escherichia coli]
MLKEMTINAILDYIEDNIEVSPIDINSLVEYSGYSRRYLQLLFFDYIGMPVGKYIQRRRVSRAAVLLRLTNLPLVTISEKLCYDSQQTFTREFKKHTGYTPLRYRKDKVWTFKNQTGHRHLDTLFPIPELRRLENKDFWGTPVNFKGKIPYTVENSQQKWNMVNSLFSRCDEPLFISNTITKENRINDNFIITSIFWAKKEHSSTQGTIGGGLFAYFFFHGSIKDYIFHMNNIYMNVLPYYGLQKRSTYDLEIITRNTDGSFCFEYYLPVNDGDITVHPDVHDVTYPPQKTRGTVSSEPSPCEHPHEK